MNSDIEVELHAVLKDLKQLKGNEATADLSTFIKGSFVDIFYEKEWRVAKVIEKDGPIIIAKLDAFPDEKNIVGLKACVSIF